MRNFIAKRIISCALAVILIVSLSAGIMAQASSPIANEGKLLEAANPILTAYKEHYVLNNVRVTNLSESSKGNGEQYIEFFLTFDATLKYDSAVDLPKVKGISKALNVDGDLPTVQDFSRKIHASETLRIINADVQSEMQSNDAASALNAIEATLSTTEGKEPVLSSAQKVRLVSDYVLDELDTFVTNLQEEYIGKSSEFNIGLRATVDRQSNVLNLEYGVFDGYSDDISTVIPASTESMIQAGEKQVSETVDMALEKVIQNDSFSAIAPTSNTSFVYYRTKARDYANKYTVNAGKRYCSTHKQNIRQSAQYYNPAYFYFCCNECANYASQAMYAGGVPQDSLWKSNKSCSPWINCLSMRNYFKNVKRYWTKVSYNQCNAGGIILLLNENKKPYHAMINVLNDSVTTKYSAHTNDRLKYVYTHSSLLADAGTGAVEYYVFDNVYPAH